MSFNRSNDESPLDAPPYTGNSALLIVDEDPAFQLGLKTFLREYVGFEKVFIARSGQEALDFLGAEPSIDLVTVDYRMPGMTGIEMLETLGDILERPLAVLMITGFPSDELEAEFRALGSENLLTSHFISKPVQFEKLEHLVLAAHDEVIAARQRALEAAAAKDAEAATETEADDSGLLLTKLDLQSARLDELENELKKQRGKWRSDFWKLAFVVFAFWIAGQFGLRQKVAPHWEKMKEAISASFSFKAPTPRAETPTPAAPAPAAESSETPAPPLPRGGEPL
jgi:CheY-like chemotaxis protein